MPRTPISVLFFSPQADEARLTKEALERDGFLVEVCPTAREGFSRVVSRDYDLYLIDVKLPDLEGPEVIQRLRTIRPNASCVVVAEPGDHTAAIHAMQQGAYDLIVKLPGDGHLATLPLLLRQRLDRRHLQDEREQLQTELWEQARLLEERNAELRRANAELRRLDQLKSDFVSMVSHELRTPLSTVKEFIAILADRLAGPLTPEQEQYLGIIRENVNRLARIIDNLLDMAKIEAGRIVLDRGIVEVGPLLEHVVQSIRPLAEHKQVALTVEVPKALPSIFADPDKVTQVLLNLVGNAVKFTGPSGTVTIGVVERDAEMEFNVTDTGAGIDPQDLPRLFEKFQQMQPLGMSGGTKGTGLGLVISKRMIELHGGRIWAVSVPGKGSTFSFVLPKYHLEEIFHEYFTSWVEQAKRKEEAFSIAAFSIANLQELKSLYGLEDATQLLAQLEAALKRAVRRRDGGDVVLRWRRGDVLIVFAAVDLEGAEALARRVAGIVAEQTFTVGTASIKLSLAVSTATYPDDGTAEAELLQVVERRLQPAAQPRTKILVVDDEPRIRHFLKEVLELREYEVATAASGPDALEQLKAHPVDLILLDLMMPVMGGYEVYHLLKESPHTKDIPVIIVTGQGERKDRQLGLEGASYNYVSKPFQVEDLLAKVQEVLLQKQSVKP